MDWGQGSSGAGLEVWLRCFAHAFDCVECKRHVQYPAFAPNSLFWLPVLQKGWSLEKTLVLGKVEGKGEEGSWGWDGWMTSMDGHELGQTPGDGEGPWGLACCSPWGVRVIYDLSNWTTVTTSEVRSDRWGFWSFCPEFAPTGHACSYF